MAKPKNNLQRLAPAKKSAPKKEDKKVLTKKAAPKKEETADDDPDPEDGSPECSNEASEQTQLNLPVRRTTDSLEEEERLAKAEAEYEERQKNRKTPSKSDKSMKEKKSAKADKTPRETKRQNLEESEEIPGLKVGSKVTLKGEDAVGETHRLYKSGDGKEKCMVKFGDDKPIKKRVTALELAEDAKPAPAKKTPKKK